MRYKQSENVAEREIERQRPREAKRLGEIETKIQREKERQRDKKPEREREMIWFLCLIACQLFGGGLLPKPSSKKNRSITIEFIVNGKGIHAFPKGISSKVNVIAQLEFKHAYYDDAVQRVNHYATGILPRESDRDRERILLNTIRN